MAGESPSLVVKVAANLEALQKSMQDMQAAIGQAAENFRSMGGEGSAAMNQVTTATETAGESMGLLESAIGGFLGAMSVEKVIQFGEAIIATGDKLQSLHDKTNLSTDTLQTLGAIAHQQGSSLDQMAQAAVHLGHKLATDSDSTKQAVEDLGYSMDQIWAMTPDQRFLTLAKAVADVEDPLRRDKDATELFGRSASELQGTFSALKEGGDAVVKMTEDQIGGLSFLASAWTKFKDSIIPATVQFIDGATHASQFYDAMKLLFGKVEEGPKVYGDAGVALDKYNNSVKDWVKQNQLKVTSQEQAFAADREFAKAQKEKEEAAKQEERELTELARAYEEYTKSVEMFQRFTFENQKKVDKELIDSAKKRAVEVNAAVKTEFDAQAKLNEAYGLTATGGIKTVTSAYDTYLQKMHDLSLAKKDGISQTAQEALITKEYTDTLYAQAVATDTATTAYKAQTTAMQERNALPPAGERAAYGGATGSIDMSKMTPENTDPMVLWYLSQGYSLNEAMALAGGYGGYVNIRGPNVRMFASGGIIGAGEPAIVGERGPEVFIPSSPGTIVPNG